MRRLVIVAAMGVGLFACAGEDLVVSTTTDVRPAATTGARANTTTASSTATTEPGTTTTVASSSSTSAPDFSAGDVAAALHGPASAYVASRGAPGEADALRAAIRAVLDSPRGDSLHAVPTAGVMSLGALLEFLADSPGFGWIKLLEQDGALTGLPVFVMDGTYTVGQNIQPGRYEALQVRGCYWETLDATGAKTASDFVTSAPRAEAAIQPSDVVFNSDGCGTWFLVA